MNVFITSSEMQPTSSPSGVWGSRSPRQVKGVLIYDVLPLSVWHRLEPMFGVVFFRLVELEASFCAPEISSL